MENTLLIFLYLVSSVIHGQAVDREKLADLDLDSLYRFALLHQMTSVVAFALDSAGIRDNRFIEAKLKTVNHIVVLDYERRAVTEELGKANIWYMPLKGAVLKDYYPYIGMREMCDCDILYDASRAPEVRHIMESQGFTMAPPDGIDHQEVFRKPPLCIFEMHPMLFDSWTDENYSLYYKDIQSKLLGDGPEKHFSDEDFYIYMITHAHKHYEWSGIGLRSLLDIYVFLRRFEGKLDWDYIRTETQKIGIDEYEQKSRAIAKKIYEHGNMDGLNTEEKDMLSYFISSGAYGRRKYVVQNRVNKVGYIRYLRERVFLPMQGVKYHYPFFYRHRILLPFLPVYRLFHKWRNACSEIKILCRLNRKKENENEPD